MARVAIQSAPQRGRKQGFTVIELLVVLAAVALLLTIAAPRLIGHLDIARETALRHNLQAIRGAIDQFAVDQGRLPNTLEELVTARYLRALPVDPITDRHDTWTLLRSATAGRAGIADVRSGATGKAQDGTSYASW